MSDGNRIYGEKTANPAFERSCAKSRAARSTLLQGLPQKASAKLVF